jgi:hypothetical protein
MLTYIFKLGVALGFVIPVSVVPNQHEESKIDQIGTDLFNMFLAVAIVTSVIFILIVICKLFKVWLKSHTLAILQSKVNAVRK